MDQRTKFEDLWANHFPDADPPKLACFEESQHGDGNFSGLVQSCLCTSRQRVDELQAQVQKEVFVIEYLEQLCNSITSNGENEYDHPETPDQNVFRFDKEERLSVKMRAKLFQPSGSTSSTDRDSIASSTSSAASPMFVSDKRNSAGKRPPPPPPRRSKLYTSLDEAGTPVDESPLPVKTPPPVKQKPAKLPVQQASFEEPAYQEPEDCIRSDDVPELKSQHYSEVENAIAKVSEGLEGEAAASPNFPTRQARAPRQNQYEEVELDFSPNEKEQMPWKMPRRPAVNAYEEVSFDAGTSCGDSVSRDSTDDVESDEVPQIYAAVDKSNKKKPLKQVSINEDANVDCLYEEVPLPPKSKALLATGASFNKSKEGSSSDEDDDEVYYKNIRMLRKQRRLTQTLHQLSEHRKSVSDVTVELPTIDDEEEKIDSIDMDSVLMGGDVFDPQGDGDDKPVPAIGSPGENEKLRMRKWVVTGILDSEHDYVATLRVLQEIRHGLEMAARSSQPVISLEDIDSMFFKIPALHKNHSNFVAQLEPTVQNWNPNSQIGIIFKEQAVYLTESVEYVKNYQKAIATFHKCCQESEQFKEMTQKIKLKPQSREVYTLDELLHKPVVRFQRGTLVLHDLLKSTPNNHPDHMWLQKAQKLTQYSLDALGNVISGQDDKSENFLVRTSLIVEQIGNSRKLRHILLYNNVFVCAKQRSGRQQRQLYEVKWHVPLVDLFIIDTSESDQHTPVDKRRDKSQQEVDTLKAKVKAHKTELRREFNKNEKPGLLRQRNWSMSGKSSRNVEKLKKKIAEMETSLVLQEPRLQFTMVNRKVPDKHYKFLLCSDYERNEWKDVITTMKTKASQSTMTSSEIQQMVDNCRQLTNVAALGSEAAVRQAMDQELMNGFLNVTLHKLEGLDAPCDMYTCIEVDSYGHFYMKAKTNIVCNSTMPEWNQDFEIELDASNTLRIMCYKHTSQQDLLLGKSALQLSPAWLRESFQEKVISMNDLNLTVSIRYTPRDKTLRKSMCRVKRKGIFGTRINHVTKQEGTKIPLIITGCVEEVERRGLNEVGIYRVSGVTSEVQTLRAEFDKQSSNAVGLLKNYDVNAVTGVLKMYLRELPEALFTDTLYPNFADAYELVDPDGRKNCMVSLLQSLPEPNFSTVVFLLNHLLRISICERENKMSPQNLATIFGPTLLRPAATNKEGMSFETLLTMETKDAMTQSGILLFFLTLLQKGASFERQEEKITQF